MAVVLSGVLLLGIAAAGGGDAARPAGNSAASGGTPPPGGIANEPGLDRGSVVEVPTARADQLKLKIRIPDFYLRGRLTVCGRGFAAPVQASSPPPCPPEFQTDLSEKFRPPGTVKYLQGGYADYYVVSRRNGRIVYGLLPATRIRALAFGTIPVEATLSLRQATSNGYLTPLHAETAFLQRPDPGQLAWPGYGKTPEGYSAYLTLNLRLQIRGSFDVYLSDVTVDGKAVDTGSNCRTRTPSQLMADLPRGYYEPLDGSNLSGVRQRGTPGGFTPLDPVPGTLDATVDIPPFTGCGTPNQDLSPILTALASGRGAISGFIPKNLLEQYWCLQAIAQCNN